MITDNRIFFFGLLIFILPLLGLPIMWKFGIIMLIGALLMFFSFKFSFSSLSSRKDESVVEIIHREEISVEPMIIVADVMPEPPIKMSAEIPVHPPKKRPGRPRKKKVDDISF